MIVIASFISLLNQFWDEVDKVFKAVLLILLSIIVCGIGLFLTRKKHKTIGFVFNFTGYILGLSTLFGIISSYFKETITRTCSPYNPVTYQSDIVTAPAYIITYSIGLLLAFLFLKLPNLKLGMELSPSQALQLFLVFSN